MKISIGENKGWLRLRWQHEGKGYSLNVGLQDSLSNRVFAQKTANQIQLDVLAGRFDETLLTYRSRTLGKNATEILVPELFRRYTQAMQRDKNLAAGSLRRYSCVQSHLEQRLNVQAQNVGDRFAGDIAAYLHERASAVTVKSYLYLLSACWDWAKGKYHIQVKNPWTIQVQKIKPQPRQKVKPFTGKEVRTILDEFKRDRYYAHYYPFVDFLFGTGCRIGEAAGLRWKHLTDNFQTAWIGETMTREKRRKCTKTGKDRTFHLNPSVQEMLRVRYQIVNPKPDDLVFPAPKGGSINDQLFNRRAWKTVIQRLGINYRKPYSTRHTAISHALANGAHYLQVAEATGHDPKVLHQSYASVIEQQSIFVEF